MLAIVLNALASVLVATIAVHAVILHIRLGRLRTALAEMGRVLPEFDASVNRVAEMADGFTVKVTGELEGIETRLQAARRLSIELASASRGAEEAAAQLDRALRQHKKLEGVRAAALPRALVEPKGFAERAGLPPVQLSAGNEGAVPDAAAPQAGDTVAVTTAGTDPEASQPSRSRLRPKRFPKAVKSGVTGSRRIEPTLVLAATRADDTPPADAQECRVQDVAA